MDSDFAVETIAPYACSAGELITAKSYLVDRFVPACELVQLPPSEIAGGRLTLRIRNGVASPPRNERPLYGNLKRLLSANQPRLELPGHAIDFRTRQPGNWAHALNNHLPLLFHIMDRLGGELQGNPTVVLPERMPSFVKEAFDTFGFPFAETNRPVRASLIEFEMTPWIGMRAIRHNWAAKAVETAPAFSSLSDRAGEFPEKIFISRRNTRRLSNELEIEAFLSARGYRKIYPEQHSIEEQFGFLSFAQEVVAVHGAALAPLLYRPRASRPFQLVELLPVGHMTKVYRVMTQQVGGRWIGVRGKILPDHVRHAYDFRRPFTKFSLEEFEVDVESLEIALGRVREHH